MPALLKEREVSWSRQHPSRTGPSRRRGCNHRSHDNLQQDLEDRRMAHPRDPVLVITLPKTGNLQQCQNSRIVSLISHPSKIMLKIILNRLTPQAETIIAEEQAGFRAGRRTTEQIFNLRILCEKYLQHQQGRYHIFIDFKKACDRVWHAVLMGNSEEVQLQHQPYPSHQKPLSQGHFSAVLFNSSIGNWL